MSKNKASNYFAEMVGAVGLHRAEITYKGTTKPCWFSRLTAGERLQLNKGNKVNVSAPKPDANGGEEEKATVAPLALDMSDFNRRQIQMVRFCACQEDGTKIFASEEEVRALPAALIDKLHAAAEDANKDEEEAGND